MAVLHHLVLPPDVGAMEPAYRRVLDLEGQDASTRSLDAAVDRLLATGTVATASIRVDGDRAVVTLREQPAIGWSVTPLPFFSTLSAETSITGLKLGSLHLEGDAWGGYEWSARRIYDPRTAAPTLMALLADNYLDGYVRGGLLVAPYTHLDLEGYATWGDPVPWPDTMFGGLYDPTPLGGLTTVVGPLLSYDSTDVPSYPHAGTSWYLNPEFGLRALGNAADYSLYRLKFSQYWPLSPATTLAFNLRAKRSLGQVPWRLAITTGGDPLPGYADDRFIGDVQLAGTVEVRQDLVPHLPDFPRGTFGLASGAPDPFGVFGLAFVALGRSWDTRYGTVQFPQDPRPSLGVGLGITFFGGPLGVLDVGVGNEGIWPHIQAGLNF